MREFIEANKNLAIAISSLLILGSVFISVRKVFFYSPLKEEKPVLLSVTGEEILVPEPEPAVSQKLLSSNIILMATIIPLLLGGWFLVRRTGGNFGKRSREERDSRRKEDLRRIQETLELYYRLRQRYPDAGDEFEEIIKNLKPPLEGSLREYRYENPEYDTRRYRLWCMLENEEDPEARKGLYQLTS